MSSSTTTKSNGVLTAAICVLVGAVCAATAIALTAGWHVAWRAIFTVIAALVGIVVAMAASSKPGSAATVIVGTLGAFASFAVLTALFQSFGGGTAPVRANSDERVSVKDKVLADGHALLQKYGLEGDASAVFGKSTAQLKGRKLGVTTVVVPGSPTALKAAAAAPAAPAPAAPAAPATPAPAPAPAAPTTPPPAPN